MKTPEEMVRFEFENDKDQMIAEILRLRAEKTTYPIPMMPSPIPPLPLYPGDYPWPYGTWCSTNGIDLSN